MNNKNYLQQNQLLVYEFNQSDFEKLMVAYEKAKNKLEKVLIELKKESKEFYGYDLINTIASRLKTQKSIIDKMKRKHYDINCNNMIDYIDDIAGIRIVCPYKTNIKMIKNILGQIPNIHILKEKDYIKKPKKSGYSGYHLIVEVPVQLQDKEVFVKVEIQIRTMAMDFWATTEHKIRYKSKNKISFFDSMKLSIYAKVLNRIDDELIKIKNRQRT